MHNTGVLNLVRFRIVSRIGLQSELKVLTFEASADERCIGNPSTCALHRDIGKRLGPYALLNLSRYRDCHYPGLAILDFIPDIARESALGTRLHTVLTPFIELSLDKTIAPIQVIATSRALPKRPHINYIELTDVWR